ncbi:MAG: aldo/keto reductase [Actinomycetaceae bacterium]|nr:aldo/keto reductase [Actinomycetaceae bacterium]
MQHRRMGNTGLTVSELGLGTLTWGRDTMLSEAESLWRRFHDAGGNLIDTAPTYGEGQAESVIGELLTTTFDRNQTVLVTKGGYRETGTGLTFSNSRNALLQSIDRSLARLQTDYIDVFLLERRDHNTPVEETLSALDMALRSGRVRYFGVSNLSAWDTAEIYYLSHHLSSPMAVVEAEYSLLQRGVERELLPALERHSIGFFAWSALARGVLTGKYRHSTPADSRAASPQLAAFVAPYLTDRSAKVVEAVAATAQGLDVTPTDVALSWLTQQNRVHCALVGPRTTQQITQILAGTTFELPQPLVEALTEVSQPQLGYPETFAVEV